MIEVEIKLKLRDGDDIAARFAAMGFCAAGRVRENDVYFDNAAGEIRKGDSALRIRTVDHLADGSRETLLTYKGKKLDPRTMTRPEYETEARDGAVLAEILRALGFCAVEPRVEKLRTTYVRGNMSACLDAVQGLGDFLELEVLAADETQRAAGLAEIETTLRELGYSMEDTVRVSYLSQLQGRKEDE